MSDHKDKRIGTPLSTDELLRRLDALLDEDWKADEEPAVVPEEASVEEKAPAGEKAPVEEKQTPKPAKQPVKQPAKQQPKQQQKKASRKQSADGSGDKGSLLHDAVYILAAVVLIFTFFVRTSQVKGNSMYPTLVDRDRMLLLSSVWYTNPQRGDIVVAQISDFADYPIVKRVIAVGGDTVDIDFDRGIVYVNGKALDEPYINALTHLDYGENGMDFPVTIEKDHVFLMGDNRNDSYDSRTKVIGQVDKRCIMGKALLVMLPGVDSVTKERDFSRLGLVK